MGSADVGERSLPSHGLEEDARADAAAVLGPHLPGAGQPRVRRPDRHQSRSRDLGRAGSTAARNERRSRDRLQSRIVFVDSEFDAKKGQGEPPGSPVCYLRDRDRPTRPRDGAPSRGTLPGAPAVGARRSVPDGRLRALGRGGKLPARGVAIPAAGDRPLCRVHGAAQHRDGARGERTANCRDRA